MSGHPAKGYNWIKEHIMKTDSNAPPLTPRQQRILAFVRERLDAGLGGPTVREIAEKFRIRSPNGVTGHLKALQRKGYITRQPLKSRSIGLAPAWSELSRGLPLAGRVHAGTLHEAVEDNAERVDFGSMFKKRGTYVLRVDGESMINAHIADGDYVVVQPNKSARTGDIAVVQTDDGQATLKYWFPEKNRIRLQPANSRMKPMYVKRARVLGVVVGVVRKV
jgi:repressor LexA